MTNQTREDESFYTMLPFIHMTFLASLSPWQLVGLMEYVASIKDSVPERLQEQIDPGIAGLLEYAKTQLKPNALAEVMSLMIDSRFKWVRYEMCFLTLDVNETDEGLATIYWRQLLGDTSPTIRQLAREQLDNLIEERERIGSGYAFLDAFVV
jgi:hypothetical protein